LRSDNNCIVYGGKIEKKKSFIFKTKIMRKFLHSLSNFGSSGGGITHRRAAGVIK
jgi:hypothetical protein